MSELFLLTDKEGPNDEVVYKYQGEYFYVDREKQKLVKVDESALQETDDEAIVKDGNQSGDQSSAEDQQSDDSNASSSNRNMNEDREMNENREQNNNSSSEQSTTESQNNSDREQDNGDQTKQR